MPETPRFFSLLAMVLLSIVIPTIYCGNACGVPNPGVPPLPNPLVPSNMSAFIISENEQDMELFKVISDPSTNLANIATESIQAALEVAQGIESITEALSDLMPIISGFADIFSGILSAFGFGSDETQNFMQAMATMCQQVLLDAERYVNQEIAQNDIQQLQANFQTASDNLNTVANSILITDDEINYVQDAENLLDLNYHLFEDQEVLSTYSYFSFNTLYVNAMLHMNTYNTLITYYINNSQVNMTLAIASAAKSHAIGYYNLLTNYSNQAQSWRLQQISDAESVNDVEDVLEFIFIHCQTTFSDNYMNAQYEYCSVEECEEGGMGMQCSFVSCGEEGSEMEYGNQCRNTYYNNVQAALSAYYNQYINSFLPFYQQYQNVQIPLAYSHPNSNIKLLQQLIFDLLYKSNFKIQPH